MKAEEIISVGIKMYNSRVSDYKKFSLSDYELGMFAGWAEEYARMQIEKYRDMVKVSATSTVAEVLTVQKDAICKAIDATPIILD